MFGLFKHCYIVKIFCILFIKKPVLTTYVLFSFL